MLFKYQQLVVVCSCWSTQLTNTSRNRKSSPFRVGNETTEHHHLYRLTHRNNKFMQQNIFGRFHQLNHQWPDLQFHITRTIIFLCSFPQQGHSLIDTPLLWSDTPPRGMYRTNHPSSIPLFNSLPSRSKGCILHDDPWPFPTWLSSSQLLMVHFFETAGMLRKIHVDPNQMISWSWQRIQVAREWGIVVSHDFTSWLRQPH